MERKIGEVFDFEGKQYEVCKTNKKDIESCADCDMGKDCADYTDFTGDCISDFRSDRRDVIFKELVLNVKEF